MTEPRNFQRLAGLAGLLVTLFIAGNVVTLFAAVQGQTAAFTDASLLLPMGPAAAQTFHVSMVFDVLAYLAFIPVVVMCMSWLRPAGEGFVALLGVCGVAYSLLGALGGVVVDALIPRMMLDFPAAAASQQEVLRLIARYSYLAVAHGVWNPLEVLMVSAWFLGTGWLLRLGPARPLGVLALVVGCLGLLDPLGWVLRNDVILDAGGLGTVLLPIWTAWFGVLMLRRAAQMPAAAAAS